MNLHFAVLYYDLNKLVAAMISLAALIVAGVSIDKSPVGGFFHVLSMQLAVPPL